MNIDRNEIRRLEKAAKDKDKRKLAEWAVQFENQIREELYRNFKALYKKELEIAVDRFIVAIAYTAHFSESSKLGKKRLPEFMEDLFVTIEMFKTGEYTPEDYKEELEKCGIKLSDIQYKHAGMEENKETDI